jgi:predicted SAM-dependent methyltransferase
MLLSSLTRHVTRGVRTAGQQFRSELRLMFRHRAAVRKAQQYREQTGLQLNLGSGPSLRPGWVNIDLFETGADLCLDIREAWPFEDGSASIVYSEHVFEHLEHPVDTLHDLQEARRVLRGGGALLLGVPDTEWPLRAYLDPADQYWELCRTWHPAHCITRLDSLNEHFRQAGQHKYAWDEETLLGLIRTAGFSGVSRRDFDADLDSDHRRLGTLYVRAVKPATPSSAN